MFDLFVFLCIFCFITGIVASISYLGSTIDTPYVPLLLFLSGIVLYLICNNHFKPENYMVSKATVQIDTLKFENTNIMVLPKKYKVVKTDFDLSWTGFADYTNYRIYLDSTTYIDIYSSVYDSLEYQKGTKLFKDTK